jgi:hypothetical protein
MGLLSSLRAKATAAIGTAPDLRVRLDAAEALLRPVVPQQRQQRNGVAGARFVDTPLGSALRDLDEDGVRAAALWAHREVCQARRAHQAWEAGEVVNAVGRRKLAWTPGEVAWALELALASVGEDWDLLDRMRLPIAAAERLPQGEIPQVEQLLRRARIKISQSSCLIPAERQRNARRIERLLTDPGATVTELPPSLLHDGDPFGPALRAELGARLNAPGVAALLVHAASATSPNPSGKWLSEGQRLLQVADSGSQLVHDILRHALGHPETLQRSHRWGEFEAYIWVHESTALLLRGLALIAGTIDEPWVTPLLGNLAVYAGGGNGAGASAPRDLLVANAAVAALSTRADAVPYLARAQARLKHRGVLKGVTKGLEAAARNAGMTRSELLESAVPTHGLDERGERREQVDEHTAVLTVSSPGGASLSFTNSSGKVLAGVPTAVKGRHADRLAQLRTEVKEIKKTLTTERLRIEALLAEDRTWAFEDWVRLYRDHPLLGRLVRGLLWQVGDGSSWTTGRLLDDGTLTDLEAAPVPAGARVRLWHPAQAPVDEVRAWRELLLDSGLRQPFKQAFREIYLLTPAELETRDHSNRFAAHILRAGQAQALMRTRGWAGNSLGYYDGGYEGHVTRDFGDDWRAEFYFDLIESDDDGYETPSLASSDQVRFSRRDGRNWALQPLADVPPLIFTEAMRDVDLFVGVTSIAADPTWITRGARDHTTYWERTSFGELNESAKTRKEALERLVPRLKIADRCTLTDRFLEVRGHLRSYKIHLGSGNILMKPNDSYLCIVPARGDKAPKVYLPFEEDGGMLSVILSKAFLLADDNKITDRGILSQINSR